ncbi:hypothetical protein E4U21_006976 [Claviceps maximensis]|nr:hypothetical protein E4U21_006976 [Claviceps maximensis]
MTTYSDDDPALYIFTSLTAGSSHIVTATSRLETILRANRVPFKAVDLAVDDKARRLWGRRAGKDDGGRPRKLPGLVQDSLVLGDLTEIEDWNEYGELKQHVTIYYDENTIPNIHNKPPEPKKTKKSAAKAAVATNTQKASKAAPPAPPAPPLPEPKPSSSSTTTTKTTTTKNGETPPADAKQTTLPLRSFADEAAQKAKELRLKSLREKVHGKGTDNDTPSSPESSSKTKKTVTKIEPPDMLEETPFKGTKSKPAALEFSKTNADDFVPEPVQSPRSGKWRPGCLAGVISGAETMDVPAIADGVKVEQTTEKTKATAKDTGVKNVQKEGEPESKDDSKNDNIKDTEPDPFKTVDSKNE